MSRSGMVSVLISKIASGQKSKPVSGIFRVHVLYMTVLIGLNLWRLHGKICKTKSWWLVSNVTGRLRILPSIFVATTPRASSIVNKGEMNANIAIIFLGDTWQTKISRNKNADQRPWSMGYWVTLPLIRPYLCHFLGVKMKSTHIWLRFWDDDIIDDVTVWLRKCSSLSQTVGVVGDDLMFLTF